MSSVQNSRRRILWRSPAQKRHKREEVYNGGGFFTRLSRAFYILCVSLFGVGLFLAAAYFVILPAVLRIEEPQNLVIVSKDLEQSEAVLFVHISPKTEKSIVAVLNGQDKVEVLGGYGEYSVQALYSLLQLEQKDEQFVRAAFSHALGVLVDTVVPVDSLTGLSAPQLQLEQVFAGLLAEDSSLSIEEKLRLYFSARSFRRNELHPKATEVSEQFGEHPLIAEASARQCQVAVVNTTGTPGLASGVGALLEQSGAFVVRVANESERYDQTVFYVQEAVNCEPVIARATKLFPNVPEVRTSQSIPLKYRAHLVIMAGADLGQAVQAGQQ